MKNLQKIFFLIFSIYLSTINAQEKMEYNKLTSEEERVILHKGTEAPYTGKLTNNKKEGTYSRVGR